MHKALAFLVILRSVQPNHLFSSEELVDAIGSC